MARTQTHRHARFGRAAALVVVAATVSAPAGAWAVDDPSGALDAPRPADVGAERVLVVDYFGDAEDAVPGDGECLTAFGSCTLRAALMEANASPGPDRIEFRLRGDGPHRIQPRSALPALSDPTGPTVIDGYTQPGARPNGHPSVSDADLRVELVGPGGTTSRFAGLRVTSGANVVTGLSIHGFFQNVNVAGPAAVGNRIVGNFIGIDPSGGSAAAVARNGANGIALREGARANAVGSPAPADRNVISGNPHQGVALYDVGTEGNTVQGNIVGLAPDGVRRRANLMHGIDLNTGAAGNLVGGQGPGEGNVVSGNQRHGIEISHDPETTGNRIEGNLVGTTASGAEVPESTRNYGVGIRVEDRVVENVVSGNVVAGNLEGGIAFSGGVKRNVAIGNLVGVGRSGQPLGNGRPEVPAPGVRIEQGAFGNVVEANTIAHSSGPGIAVEGATTNNNRLTRNATWANAGLGIDLAPIGVVNPPLTSAGPVGPNKQLGAPVLTSVTPDALTGRGCGGCTIEVFVAEGEEGRRWVGDALVVNGSFTFPADGLHGERVTATATDRVGNTTELSAVSVVPHPEPGPAPGPAPAPGPLPGTEPLDASEPLPGPEPVPVTLPEPLVPSPDLVPPPPGA